MRLLVGASDADASPLWLLGAIGGLALQYVLAYGLFLGSPCPSQHCAKRQLR